MPLLQQNFKQIQLYFVSSILVVALCFPFVASAQLTSSHYQIDSYTIGENTLEETGISERYIVEFGVENLEYGDGERLETQVQSSGGGSSGRRSSNDDDNESTSETEGGSTEILYDPFEDVFENPFGSDPGSVSYPVGTFDPEIVYQVPVVPYVAPKPKEFVQPPAALIEVSVSDVIAYNPKYSDSEVASADDDTVVTFYKTLPSGTTVYITIPNTAFSTPNGFDDTLGPYQIYFVVTEELLSEDQQPAEEYDVTLLGDRAYNISIIDSLDRVLSSTKEPIGIRLVIDDTLDYSINTRGYFFNSTVNAWIALSNLVTESQAVEFFINKPVLFGLWGGQNLPSVLSIFTTQEPEPEEVAQVAVEPEVTACVFVWGIPCKFWWVVLLPLLPLFYAGYRYVRYLM